MSRTVTGNPTALVAPGLLVWGLLFALPLAAVVVVSFFRVAHFLLIPDFVLANYARLVNDLYVQVFVRSVRVAFIVATISLLVGFPLAYFLARKVRKRQLLLLMAIITPLWISYVVRTFAWMQILGTNGLANVTLQGVGLISEPVGWFLYSEFAVVVALVHIYMPFMVVPIYAVLERLDQRHLEAAYDLGASKLAVLWKITIPLAKPGIIAGYLFVFIPAVGAFVTPEILGGTSGLMIGSIIAQQFGANFEYPFGAALAVVLVALITAVAIVLLRVGASERS